VLLATGVVETVPPNPGMAEAIKQGIVRVCPICDGHEARGRKVAVLGDGDHAAREALFLRTYALEVTVLLTGEVGLTPAVAAEVERAGVGVMMTGLASVVVQEDGVTAGGDAFDLLYSAFGVTPQVKLAHALGVALDGDGRIKVGEHQETSAPGVFAAGDVVRGLNQIAVAEGEGAIAASAIHNRLPRTLCGR
jgi:thioredoxin reductase (NADPH)